ncbi:MAG: phosphatase PAP2 family protein [Armatimonadota bacterium]
MHSPASPPRPRLLPPGRPHGLGWAVVVIGLIVTLLTPKFGAGLWKDIGSAISDKPYSPYNLFLSIGIISLLYLAYAERSKASFLRVTLVMVTETALYGLIKSVTWFGFHLFPRPSGTSGGFPSGHTAAVCALAYLLTERWPKLAFLWYSAAAIVGWARWTSGAHYPYQVVGGAILGLTVAVALAHRFPEKQEVGAEPV